MAYEFKKLSEVDAIGTMSDNTNVIAEENGEIVKLPADSIVPKNVALKSDIPQDVVKRINGNPPDSSGNINIQVANEDPQIFYCYFEYEENVHRILYWDEALEEGEGGPVHYDDLDYIIVGKDMIGYEYDGYEFEAVILGKSYEAGGLEGHGLLWFMGHDGLIHFATTVFNTEA